MIRIMLDTSAYSAFMRGHPAVKEVLREVEEVCLNPIIFGELLSGFRKGRYREKNERELQAFSASPRVRIVNLDQETGERYAVILNTLWQAGTPIPTNDIWIAASAMQHGLSIVTTDAHYQRVAQVLVQHIQAT